MVQTDLAQLSLLLVYGAMAAYTVALLAFAADLFGARPAAPGPDGRVEVGQGQAGAEGGSAPVRRRAAGIAMTTTYLAAVLHGIGIVLRGVAAGRVPWANMYEFTLVFTFVAVVAFLVLQRRWDLRALGTFVVGPVDLLLGIAVAVLYVRADGLPPALDSYWLVIHVSVATLSIGIFCVAGALAVVQLLQDRAEVRADSLDLARTEQPAAVSAGGGTAVLDAPPAPGRPDGDTSVTSGGVPAGGGSGAGGAEEPRAGRFARILSLLPSSVEIERIVFRLNGIGFVLWTFTLVAGAIWAEHAWGRPWGWDAKEAWSFGIWVVYAAYLHARTTRGWQGRRSAYLTLTGVALIAGNYFIVNLLLNSRHAYSGIG